MKVYIAHNYAARRDYLFTVGKEITNLGISITSRWITMDQTAKDPVAQARYALMDFEDVDNADMLIHFADPYVSANSMEDSIGRGKYVEVGYALAKNIPCIIVGNQCRECVFYFHPLCTRFKKYYDMLKYLAKHPK